MLDCLLVCTDTILKVMIFSMLWLSKMPVTKVSTAMVGVAPAACKKYYICQCGGISLLAFIIHLMSSCRPGSVPTRAEVWCYTCWDLPLFGKNNFLNNS